MPEIQIENFSAHAELLDRAHDSVILTDAVGTILSWNRGSERIYGWTREEALGQNVHALLKTQLADKAAAIEAKLQEQSHWEGELQQMRRDGSRLWVTSHWTLKDAGTESLRLQINTDITARRKTERALRHSEERYRRFVDEDLTGNLIIRCDGSIVTCNAAFVRDRKSVV